MLEINFQNQPQDPWKPITETEDASKEGFVRLENGNHLKWAKIGEVDPLQIEKLHDECLPVKYDQLFYNLLSTNRIQSLSLVDSTSGKLIGIITSQTRPASQSEDSSGVAINNWLEESVLTYILTLCVSKEHRRQGIASMLLRKLIEHSAKGEVGYTQVLGECSMHYFEHPNPFPHSVSEISRDQLHLNQMHSNLTPQSQFNNSTCRCKKATAVYLHVLSSNQPAIQFYEGHRFSRMKTLRDYYVISSKNYHAYAYAIFINGGKPPIQFLKRFHDVFEITENIITQTLDLIRSFFTFNFGRSEEQMSQTVYA